MDEKKNCPPNKKDDTKSKGNNIYARTHPRKINQRDRLRFLHEPRDYSCLLKHGKKFIEVDRLDNSKIRKRILGGDTIEHQFIILRKETQLTPKEYNRRYKFTQCLLECFKKHHNMIYEGILYGSSVNGLGFKDSDVDLRLRALKKIGDNLYEPVILDDETVEATLRNIATQTTLCSLAAGTFVPSSRCPVAKLSFFDVIEKTDGKLSVGVEGLNYDVSLSAANCLGVFNSMFLRFLCHLEPKFHLLATVIRFWSNRHGLISAGLLSSYALINMLIYFCQTVQPPLLPTIDYMRELYFANVPESDLNSEEKLNSNYGLTRLEYSCIVCMRKELYTPSANDEPLGVLLLKFFELYLNFPYSTHIITTRPGKAIESKDFSKSSQYHPRFPIQTLLNIQDPFDLKHNLTSGMQASHFHKLLLTIRYSYENLFQELLNNFHRPELKGSKRKENGKIITNNMRDWGLSMIFVDLPDK